MCEWHTNQVANVMDADKKSFDSFFSDEVIDNLFSDIRRECERHDSEQSVSLDDEELQKFLEEKKKQ